MRPRRPDSRLEARTKVFSGLTRSGDGSQRCGVQGDPLRTPQVQAPMAPTPLFPACAPNSGGLRGPPAWPRLATGAEAGLTVPCGGEPPARAVICQTRLQGPDKNTGRRRPAGSDFGVCEDDPDFLIGVCRAATVESMLPPHPPSTQGGTSPNVLACLQRLRWHSV